MKIRPVGAEFFHADRRTDMTKLLVAFRKFANAPKNDILRRTVACFPRTASRSCVSPSALLSTWKKLTLTGRIFENSFVWGLLSKFIYTIQIC